MSNDYDASKEYWKTLTRRVASVILSGTSETSALTVGEIGSSLCRDHGTDGFYPLEHIREALKHPPFGVTVSRHRARYWASGTLPLPTTPEEPPQDETTQVRPRYHGALQPMF